MKSIKLIFLLTTIVWSTQMFGQSQYALSFDGVNDYVSLGTDPSLDIKGPVTVETWLYFTVSQLQYKRFVVKQFETSYNLGVGASANSILWGMAPNGSLNNMVETAPGVLTAFKWVHIAGTWDGDTLRIFVNGEQVAKKAWINNSVPGSIKPTVLGIDQNLNTVRCYSGLMDEVRIWNIARTPEQLRDNMYKELDDPSMEPNLVAYYRFNEGSGQTSADLSLNSNTAVLGGTSVPEISDPTWVVSGAPIPYYTNHNGQWNNTVTWLTGQGVPDKPWARAIIHNTVNIPVNVQMNEIRIAPLADLSLDAGFNMSVHQLFSVEGSGSFTMNQNCDLTMGSNSSIIVEDEGVFYALGSDGNESLISGTGYYSFDVNNGGTLGATYTTFEYMDLAGVNIEGEIDLSYPFDHCTFQNGESGGTLITFSGTEPATLTNVHFPANTWGGSYNVSKVTNQGQIEFVDASGGFAGAGYEFDPYDLVDWGEFFLEVKVLLEGAFNGFGMNTNINPILPLTQPFNVAPWNYSGTESVPSIPGTDIVDWILVELRDAPDAVSATPLTTINIQAAFINDMGEIVDLDGASPLRFGNTINDDLYVVIWHRNHLSVMSAFALDNNSGTFSYDFSTSAAQFYGGASGNKEIASGIWGMVCGDSNADGIVDDDDKTLSWNNETGTAGYLSSDLDLDGQSNNIDKNDFWFPNLGKSSQVPD